MSSASWSFTPALIVCKHRLESVNVPRVALSCYLQSFTWSPCHLAPKWEGLLLRSTGYQGWSTSATSGIADLEVQLKPLLVVVCIGMEPCISLFSLGPCGDAKRSLWASSVRCVHRRMAGFAVLMSGDGFAHAPGSG